MTTLLYELICVSFSLLCERTNQLWTNYLAEISRLVKVIVLIKPLLIGSGPFRNKRWPRQSVVEIDGVIVLKRLSFFNTHVFDNLEGSHVPNERIVRVIKALILK